MVFYWSYIITFVHFVWGRRSLMLISFSCPMAGSIWWNILNWLHLNPATFTYSLENHLLPFYVRVKGKMFKRCFFSGGPLFEIFGLRGMKSFLNEVLKKRLISCYSLSLSLGIGYVIESKTLCWYVECLVLLSVIYFCLVVGCWLFLLTRYFFIFIIFGLNISNTWF